MLDYNGNRKRSVIQNVSEERDSKRVRRILGDILGEERKDDGLIEESDPNVGEETEKKVIKTPKMVFKVKRK